MTEITFKINLPENIQNLLQVFLDSQASFAVPPPVEDKIWNVDDICAAFKISKTKVYSLTMQTGQDSIPRFKVGRALRFKKLEVIEWFNKQRVI